MIKADIENYIQTKNSENNIITLTKEYETDDVIIYTLTTSKAGYVYSRNVLLVALRLSTNVDCWNCFAPTESQIETLTLDLPKIFKRIWNSNIENKGGKK